MQRGGPQHDLSAAFEKHQMAGALGTAGLLGSTFHGRTHLKTSNRRRNGADQLRFSKGLETKAT